MHDKPNFDPLYDEANELEKARDLSAALVMVIRGGLEHDVIDGGFLGQGIHELANDVLDRLASLCERTTAQWPIGSIAE